jgi:CelD/BcsL family acetyltransferase involved in cellulose biosynthesis
MAGIQCEIVTDFARLQTFAQDWQRIALQQQEHSRGTVFQSWEWARACWDVRTDGTSLFTPVATDSGRVVGIFPLVLKGSSITSLSSPYADYNDIICELGREVEVLDSCSDALVRSSEYWAHGRIENVPDKSVLFSALAAVSPRTRKHFTAVPRFIYSVVREEPAGGNMNRMSRKRSFRQHENQLSRDGKKLLFRHLDDRDEIRVRLDDFFGMHIARSALSGRQSLFTSESARRFVHRLVEYMNPTAELRLSTLELDGRAVGYQLGFENNSRLLCYISTFDVDYWDFAPGEVLFRNLFKYADQNHVTEFDLTIGDETYKSRFANFVGQTYTIHFDRRLLSPAVAVTRALRYAETGIRRWPKALARARQTTALARRAATETRNLVPAVRRRLVSLHRPRTLQVTLNDSPPGAIAVKVEKVGLRTLGLYLLDRHLQIDSQKLKQLRNTVKQGADLHLVSTTTSEYLIWKFGEKIWEDTLTYASPTKEFAFAIAAMLATTEERLLLTTPRAGFRPTSSLNGLVIREVGNSSPPVTSHASEEVAVISIEDESEVRPPVRVRAS